MDSPVALATAGTVVIHLLLALVGDAIVDAFPPPAYKPAPVVELVDIEPLPPPPPPPPPAAAALPIVATAPIPTAPEPRVQHIQPRTTQPVPPPREPLPPPPANTPPANDSGGSPVTTMEDIAPAAKGVAVAKGPRGGGGRGGTGGGTGSGTGTGSSDAPATPMSVATIKSRAMPKGDFSYFDASKDYPAEAKSLGIEGVIRVRLVVDAAGAVKSAILINKLGHGLDELALERAKKIQFEPAKDTDDKPVSSVVVWTFNMTLPK
jgi:protein TonB